MDVYLIVDGTSYNLNDGTLAYLSDHDGLGLPPMHRLEDRGPEQHGSSDLGFRLDPRVFTLVFSAVTSRTGTRMSNYYDDRDTWLRYLRPLNDALKWKFVLPTGDTRQIDCHTVQAPMPYKADGTPLLQRVAVQCKAADPTFYDPVQESVVFGVAGGGDGFDIPLVIPTEVGVSTLDDTKTIDYSGTWYAFPTIKIVGPITNCVITNTATDEKLDFTGTTIANGDYYEIDTRYGYKTVVDSSDANKIGDLTTDSDLGTFHLEPPMGGDASLPNVIQAEGSSITSVTEIYFRYYVRYIGL